MKLTCKVLAIPLVLAMACSGLAIMPAEALPAPTAAEEATSEAQIVAIDIAADQQGSTALFLTESETIIEADLLTGVSAADESGGSVAVTIKDMDGLDLMNPVPKSDPSIPYIILFAAVHPDSGEVVTATRDAYIVGAVPLLAGPSAYVSSNTYVNNSWDGSETLVYFPGDPSPHSLGTDAFATIGEAIANTDPGGTVYIAGGTYTGSGNTNLAIGKSITIAGTDRTEVIIDAQEQSRIFSISNNMVVTIKDITIKNGRSGSSGGGVYAGSDLVLTLDNCIFENNGTTGYGNALYVDRGIITITDCMFKSNHRAGVGAYSAAVTVTNTGTGSSDTRITMTGCTFDDNKGINGGGLSVYNTSKTSTVITALSDCSFIGNEARDYGGGIYISGDKSITDLTGCMFTGNSTGLSGATVGCTGGGAHINGTVTLTDCGFTGNTAERQGGGFFMVSGSATLGNCTFTNNSALTSLGGGAAAGGNLELTSCTFEGNTAGANGGGVLVTGGKTLTMNDCAIIGNTSGSAGSGIAAIGTVSLEDCTIAGNKTDAAGSGVYVAATGGVGGRIDLANCTLSGNEAAGNGGAVYASVMANFEDCIITGNIAGSNGSAVYTASAGFSNCTLSGNEAKEGNGGVWANTVANLKNCTLDDNTVGGSGAALYAMAANLANCTLSDNTAKSGDGGGVWTVNDTTLMNCTLTGNEAAGNGGGMRTGGSANIYGSIVAGNTATASGNDVFENGAPWEDAVASVSNGYSIIGGDKADIFGMNTLADNGGDTKTILIDPNGPARNHIPESSLQQWKSDLAALGVDIDLGKDQRGAERPDALTVYADIGAVELQCYTLSIQAGAGGSITKGANGAHAAGEAIPIEAAPDSGYGFDSWSVSARGSFDDASSASTTFIMPDSDTALTAAFNALTAPTITGPMSMTLEEGYESTSTGTYTIEGNPTPTIAKTSDNPKIAWSDEEKRLDIGAGLPAGTYSVTLSASNGVGTDATVTFKLTVKARPVTPPAPPVEPPAPPVEPPITTSGTTPSSTTPAAKGTDPVSMAATDDRINILVWLILPAVSLVGICALAYAGHRKRSMVRELSSNENRGADNKGTW